MFHNDGLYAIKHTASSNVAEQLEATFRCLATIMESRQSNEVFSCGFEKLRLNDGTNTWYWAGQCKMLMHGNISLFVGLKSERLKSERLNTEQHLYPFGVQRTERKLLRRHLAHLFSYTLVKKLVQKAGDLGTEVTSVNIVPTILTWRILLLIELRQGEEKALLCLCMYLLSLLLCTTPHLWPAGLLVMQKKIDGSRKQNKTCAYVFSWPPKEYTIAIFTRWDGSGCKSLARNFV